MESATLVGAFSPALTTRCLLPSSPGQLAFMSERNKHYACKRLPTNHIVRIRCEGGSDMDRRQLLLSSSTLGLSVLTGGNAISTPFPVPDFSKCVYPTDLPNNVTLDGGCCPPFTSQNNIVDFKFPTDLPMRRRNAAHLVDEGYIQKYHTAIKRMKELPEDDPRNFFQQAKVHCAYCNGSYLVGPESENYKVHGTWFFAPFHRWYMYFFERICAKMINDDNFTLPFWNWDTEAGMQIPPMFTRKELSLYNPNRDPCHQPPKIINLDNYLSCDTGSVRSNYCAVYTHMVLAKNAEQFHGKAYRYLSDDNTIQAGELEASPHNLVHRWVGSSENEQREDMGQLYSAGRDPLFYCHHINVDRMWNIWNRMLGRKNYNDPDLLNSQFLFYDENKQLVRVKAGDCYDISKLKYGYQVVDKPWLDRGRAHKKAGKIMPKPDNRRFQQSSNQPTELKAPVTIRVKRPTPIIQGAEETLCVEGIELDMTHTVTFKIFINFPDANAETSICNPHFAGTFVHFGHGKPPKKPGVPTMNPGGPPMRPGGPPMRPGGPGMGPGGPPMRPGGPGMGPGGPPMRPGGPGMGPGGPPMRPGGPPMRPGGPPMRPGGPGMGPGGPQGGPPMGPGGPPRGPGGPPMRRDWPMGYQVNDKIEAKEVNFNNGKGQTTPGAPMGHSVPKFYYKIGIKETLEDINAAEDEDVTVTLVPPALKFQPKTPVKFTSVRIVQDN